MTIGQLRQILFGTRNANEILYAIIKRRQVAIAYGPVHAVPIKSVGTKVDVAPSIALASPRRIQNQPKITWPANFIVARAYIDQLNRSSALAPQRITALNGAIAKVEASRSNRKDVDQLQAMAGSLDKDAAQAKTPADAERMRALAAIIKKSGTSRP